MGIDCNGYGYDNTLTSLLVTVSLCVRMFVGIISKRLSCHLSCEGDDEQAL